MLKTPRKMDWKHSSRSGNREISFFRNVGEKKIARVEPRRENEWELDERPQAGIRVGCVDYLMAPKAAKHEFLWRMSTVRKPTLRISSSWKVRERGESSLSI